MLNGLRYRVDSARQILKTEGIVFLLRRVDRFMKWRFFVYVTHYLYEATTKDFQTLKESDYMPKIDNFTLRIVFSNEEADKLEAEGFEFRSHDNNSRYYLDNGAVAFCFFIGNELAHVGWSEMTRQLTDTEIMKVDYSNNEVHGGWSWTNPRYRRMGFGKYSNFKKGQFAYDKGKTIARWSMSKSNIASQASQTKTVRRYAVVRYLKILGREFVKTTYVDGYKPPTTS